MQIKNEQKEKNFQSKVIQYLKKKNIYYIKIISATRNGVPDIIICKNGKFIGLEIKTDTGIVAPLQKYNQELIKKSGGTSYIVRPSNWDYIKKILDK